MRSSHFVLPFALLFLVSGTSPAGSDSSSLATSPGLDKVTFQTPAGSIRVHLPDDMAAGDTISGVVVAEPSGATDAERNQNSGTLQGYVIDLEKTKTSVRDRVMKWSVPAHFGKSATLILRDPSGKVVSRQAVPVLPTPAHGGPIMPEPLNPVRGGGPSTNPPARGPVPPEPLKPGVPPRVGGPIMPEPLNGPFKAASIGQTGHPFVITGPFDGDSSNTKVSLSDKPATVLAESPRQAVVEVPLDVTGMTSITVTEPNTSSSQPAAGKLAFRAIGVTLTAPKTALLRGETTILRVEVSGLEGLREPVQLTLTNYSQSVVTIEGGNTQSIAITPEQTNAPGIFSTQRTLTGSGRGNFDIGAVVEANLPAPRTLTPDRP